MALPLRLLAPNDEQRAARRTADERPKLHVVPARRRAAWFIVVLMTFVSAIMLGAVLLHTTVAERQLEIDRLEQGVRDTQERFDELRAQRAELRSPSRLAAEASALGMVPGTDSTYTTVEPQVLARVIAATGEMPGADTLDIGVVGGLDPLQQYRLVKEVASENS